jgi:hypothetical protein
LLTFSLAFIFIVVLDFRRLAVILISLNFMSVIIAIMEIAGNDQCCLPIDLGDVSHRLALRDLNISMTLEVVIEEIEQHHVLFEVVQLVNAESVHVVVDLDYFLALCTPLGFNFLAQNNSARVIVIWI